jgi:preprotein translocase subunit SecE
MAKTAEIVAAPTNGLERLKTAPARISEFLKDVRAEMKKVVTPTRAEVQTTTVVVIVTVFIFAGYFAIVDFLASNTVNWIIKQTTK